jgi:hypothetical protein
MTISFLEPFGKAWTRMKIALFKPFNLHKWFVVGFSAFLAGLAEGGGPNGSGGGRYSDHGDFSFGDFLDFPHRAWDWLIDNPGWFIGIIFITGFIIILACVLTWLSSKGTFMFIDNVAHDKAEIVKPWRNYSKEANSLFFWRIVFGIICFVVFVSFVVFFFVVASRVYESNAHRVPVLFIVQMALVFLFLILITGYISAFLTAFVAPIMYKDRISAVQAWGRFLSLFKKYPFHFLFYGIFIFVLTVLAVISLIIAGLMMCCVGILLLIIPYINTVVTLPVWYTFRAFSLEFLAQFGSEYDVYPMPEAPAVNAEA